MPLKHPSYILKCDPIAAYKSDFDLNGYINLRLTVSVRKIMGVNKMSDGTKKKNQLNNFMKILLFFYLSIICLDGLLVHGVGIN